LPPPPPPPPFVAEELGGEGALPPEALDAFASIASIDASFGIIRLAFIRNRVALSPSPLLIAASAIRLHLSASSRFASSAMVWSRGELGQWKKLGIAAGRTKSRN